MSVSALRYIPSGLTFARLALTPLLVRFISTGQYMAAVAVCAVVCLTDVFDGATARALGVCSRLGASMDVIADLVYVMTALIVLNMRGLAPVWFTIVVVMKFVEFALTSFILKADNRTKSIWLFDGLGRCFAALAFVSPGVICVAALLPGVKEYLIYALLILTCAFAAASSAARIGRCLV